MSPTRLLQCDVRHAQQQGRRFSCAYSCPGDLPLIGIAGKLNRLDAMRLAGAAYPDTSFDHFPMPKLSEEW